MGQINTTNMPDYLPEARGAGTQVRTNDGANEAASAAGAITPQDDLQFTRLSGVLNSFKKGATAMRNQVSQVMSAVRGGTYQVDSLEVSRSIVGDCLAQH